MVDVRVTKFGRQCDAPLKTRFNLVTRMIVRSNWKLPRQDVQFRRSHFLISSTHLNFKHSVETTMFEFPISMLLNAAHSSSPLELLL